ncbi:hypothetical protein GYA49_02395 [Candidatus Beckwithbacteria bacterium]|nr:hypothetical protein [Candidatus Beckwithbacteria bacterium]
MKLSKTLLASPFFITYFLLFTASEAFAQSNWYSSQDGSKPATFKDLEIVFSNILGLFIPLAGAAVFIMIIIGGFTYMTSGGNPEANAKAGTTLTWAVVGLLFLLGGWFILRFISNFTGVDVTIFTIPAPASTPNPYSQMGF